MPALIYEKFKMKGLKMPQYQPIERIFEIDRQIRAGLYPKAEDIATKFECSRRVIFNDKSFMVDRLGAPIEFDRDRGGWYYTDSTWVLPSTMISEGELLAFLLSIEVAQRHLGTALESSLRSAVEKIARNVKVPVKIDLEQLCTIYGVVGPITNTVNEHVLLDLYKAIQDRRQVWINYIINKRGEWTERIVNPHYLYYENDGWYLFAFDHLWGQMRNFHLGGINRMEILDQTFEWNPGFSIEDRIDHALQGIRGEEPVEVVIQFDAYQVRWIRECHWPHPPQFEDLADGGLIFRFKTGNLERVKQWVMQYGRHAEVLAPPKLRAQIVEELRAASERYKDN